MNDVLDALPCQVLYEWRSHMIHRRRSVLPYALVGSGAVAVIGALILMKRMRVHQTEPRLSPVDDWENEGGQVIGPTLHEQP